MTRASLQAEFRAAAARHGDRPMMRQKDFGVWREHTWAEVARTVEDLAAGLLAEGVQPGETVSVLADTRREWVWADLAGLSAGAVVSGIYPTDSAEQVRHLCADSRTVVLVVENDEQLDKALGVRDALPDLRRIAVIDMKGLAGLDDPQVISLDALRAAGRARLAAQPDCVAEAAARRGGDDTAILVYTSGTTGPPKGAMLSHANLIASCAAFEAFLPRMRGGDRLNYLPLCHVAERVFGEYVAIRTGAVMNFVENPETVLADLREEQPDALFAVPRIWEKLHSGVVLKVREATWTQRQVFDLALRLGARRAAAREAGRRLPPHLAALHAALDATVLANVRRMLGLDNLRHAFSGAAPVSADLLRWFAALGIDIAELWGMTEYAGGATCNPPGRARPGTVGPALPGVEMRLDADGEILLRGPQLFRGYLNLPEATAAAMEDGWFRTGDVGRLDEAGHLIITDRKKDIMITAGGKNVAPSEIENQLKASPYIADAVAIGDRRPYLTALVMIDHENVEHWAQDRQVAFSDYRSLTRAPEVRALIEAEIAAANRRFARVEQIKDFRLIDAQLTAEDEELTATLKLKRAKVAARFGPLVEAMYAPAAAPPG